MELNDPILRGFIRTCQSCGNEQEGKDPGTYKDKTKEAWNNVKCKACGDSNLDYGSEKHAKECKCEWCE